VAVGEFRAETGDLEDFLKCPGAAHDLAVDRADGGVVERALVVLTDVLKDFFFPGRGKDFAAVLEFHFADFAGKLRPFVHQLENVEVVLVDLRA